MTFWVNNSYTKDDVLAIVLTNWLPKLIIYFHKIGGRNVPESSRPPPFDKFVKLLTSDLLFTGPEIEKCKGNVTESDKLLLPLLLKKRSFNTIQFLWQRSTRNLLINSGD